MLATKNLGRNLKLFSRIFAVIFIIVFSIFTGTVFRAIVSYKIRHLIGIAKEEITRPPALFDSTTVTSLTGDQKMITLPAVPLEAQTANILELPEFGIKAPIWKIDTPDSKLIYEKLKLGVVLYPGSAIPGQGYSIIIGHSSQYPWQPGKYKSVFSLLSELQIGDKIYVYWEQKPLVFEVQETKIFLPWPKGSEITETIFPPEDKPILILQSCWPVGVAYKRVAVKTVLVSGLQN
ncbi:MAG: sortase [Candidatus Paceibacterota bacterium]|jgi:LPXTG-site transpeptidase (sortase) family protein